MSEALQGQTSCWLDVPGEKNFLKMNRDVVKIPRRPLLAVACGLAPAGPGRSLVVLVGEDAGLPAQSSLVFMPGDTRGLQNLEQKHETQTRLTIRN